MFVVSDSVTSLKRHSSTGVSVAFNEYFRTPVLKKHLLSQVSFWVYSDFRSSRSPMFFKIVVLKNFAIFIGNSSVGASL